MHLPPACRPGLEAILREANRVRLARLLDQRPVTRRALEELKQWAGHGLLDALRADEDLAEFLALGEGGFCLLLGGASPCDGNENHCTQLALRRTRGDCRADRRRGGL